MQWLVVLLYATRAMRNRSRDMMVTAFDESCCGWDEGTPPDVRGPLKTKPTSRTGVRHKDAQQAVNYTVCLAVD